MESSQFLGEFHLTFKEFHVSTNSEENFSQLLKKFRSIFKKIFPYFKENFTQFLRKFYSIFNKISHYITYLNNKVPKNLCTVDKNNVYLHVVRITRILFGLFRCSDNREANLLVRIIQRFSDNRGSDYRKSTPSQQNATVF